MSTWEQKIVVIPHFAGDRERNKNLRMTLNHLDIAITHGWRVIVVEMGSYTDIKEFNVEHIVSRDMFVKSKAWNMAFKYVLNEMLGQTNKDFDKVLMCLLDNDILFHDTDFLTESDPLRGKRYAHPFNRIYDTDMVEVWDIEKYGVCALENIKWDNLRKGLRCYGGASLCRLGDIVRIGGFDEKFVKWGHEDDLFHYAMLRLVKFENYTRFDQGIVHLVHPIKNTTTHLISSQFLTQQGYLYERINRLKKPQWEDEFCKNGKYLRYRNFLVDHV